MSSSNNQTGTIKRCWLRFCELSTEQLHAILKLRQDVFVVEQNCAFAEIDGLDPLAHHLLLTTTGQLVGYCRVLPADTDPGSGAVRPLSIGRIVVHPSFRDRRLGTLLMEESVRFCETQFAGHLIHLAAQTHLQNFYAQHGFESTGQTYLEDGIPHAAMLRKT